jgi:hypothetical protein
MRSDRVVMADANSLEAAIMKGHGWLRLKETIAE